MASRALPAVVVLVLGAGFLAGAGVRRGTVHARVLAAAATDDGAPYTIYPSFAPTAGRRSFCDDDDDDDANDDGCVPVEYCEDDDPSVAPQGCIPKETPAACDWCSAECATHGKNHPHIKQLTCEYCEEYCVVFTYEPSAQPTRAGASRKPSRAPTAGPTDPTTAPSRAPTPNPDNPKPTLPAFELGVDMRMEGVEASAFTDGQYVYAFKQSVTGVLGLRVDTMVNFGAVASVGRRLRARKLASSCLVTFDLVIHDATNVSTIFDYEADVRDALEGAVDDGAFAAELVNFANMTGSAEAVKEAKHTVVIAVAVATLTSDAPTTAYAPTYAPTTETALEATRREEETWRQRARRFFATTILWVPVWGWLLACGLLACLSGVFAWLSHETSVEWLPAKPPPGKHPWWVEEDYGGRSSPFDWRHSETSRAAYASARLAGSRAESYALLRERRDDARNLCFPTAAPANSSR